MDEKQLKALYEAMGTKLDLPDYEAFKTQLSSDGKFRKAFYDEASTELDLGDFNTFDSSFKKKEPTANVPSSQLAPTSGTPSDDITKRYQDRVASGTTYLDDLLKSNMQKVTDPNISTDYTEFFSTAKKMNQEGRTKDRVQYVYDFLKGNSDIDTNAKTRDAFVSSQYAGEYYSTSPSLKSEYESSGLNNLLTPRQFTGYKSLTYGQKDYADKLLSTAQDTNASEQDRETAKIALDNYGIDVDKDAASSMVSKNINLDTATSLFTEADKGYAANNDKKRELEYQNPYSLTSLSDMISRTVKRGMLMGETADILTATSKESGIDVERLADLQRQQQDARSSKAYENFIKDFSWENFKKNPIGIITELSLESLVALYSHGASRMGAGVATGAALGSVVPGIGTVAGASSGMISGLGLSSLNLEFSSTLLDQLSQKGVDITDVNQLRDAFANKELMSDIKKTAYAKGIPVAMFDMLSAGLAGKFISGAKTLGGKLLAGAAETAQQAVTGAAGEALGQKIAYGEIKDYKSVALEALGEVFPGTVETVYGNVIESYKNNQKPSTQDLIVAANDKKATFNNIDVQQGSGIITPEQAQQAKDDINKVKEVTNKMPQDMSVQAAGDVMPLIEQRDKLSKQLETVDDSFKPQLKSELDGLDKQIQDIYNQDKQGTYAIKKSTGVVQEGVPESGIVQPSRVETQGQEVAQPQTDVSNRPVSGAGAVITLAPFYNTKVTTQEEAQTLRQSPEYQQYKESIPKVAESMGLQVDDINETIGGFVNDKGEKIVEVSNRVFLKNATIDQAEEFAAIMGVMTPETQEATIAGKYLAKGETVPDDEYVEQLSIKVGDIDKAIETLKDADIYDFTIDESEGTVSFLDFSKGTDATFDGKIANFINALQKKNITYEKGTRSPVNSRYITPERRTQILTGIANNADRLQQGGQGFRSVITQALDRDRQFRGVQATAKELGAELGGQQDVESIVGNAQKSLKATGVSINVMDDEAAYETEASKAGVQKGTEGLFISPEGKIIINKKKLGDAINAGIVVWHEASHPVMNIIRNTDKARYDAVVNGLTQAAKTDRAVANALQWAKDNYQGTDVQNDEAVVETIARVASGDINLDNLETGFRQSFIDFINKISRALGFGDIVSDTSSKQFKDTVTKVADALKTGRGVEEIVGTENVGEYGVPFNQPTQTRVTDNYGEPVKVEKEYPLSFVKQDDIIDIKSLVQDIASKGQKVWFWVADQLGRGLYYDKQIGAEHYLDAGPSFALDPNNRSNRIIWATGKSEAWVNKNIANSDYIFIISGSPSKSKLFNKRVSELVFNRIKSVVGQENAWDTFKQQVLEVSKIGAINDILNKYNSFDELLASPDRKELLIQFDNQKIKKGTPLKALLDKYGALVDYDELRDGFYRENDFQLNDVMLVLKPEKYGGVSEHSTYEHDIIGDVVGVPDRKLNAFDIMPDEVKNKYEKEMTKTMQSQAVAPYGAGIREVQASVGNRKLASDTENITLEQLGVQPNLDSLSAFEGPFQPIYSAIKSAGGDKVNINVTSFDKRLAGLYKPGSNEILLNSSAMSNQYYVVAHELMHWLTIDSDMAMKGTEFRNLDQIFKAIKNKVDPELLGKNISSKLYGLTNVKEFMAELILNDDFRNQLADITVSDKDIKDAIIKNANKEAGDNFNQYGLGYMLYNYVKSVFDALFRVAKIDPNTPAIQQAVEIMTNKYLPPKAQASVGGRSRVNEPLSDAQINSLRASLRLRYPDSQALDILDRLQQAKKSKGLVTEDDVIIGYMQEAPTLNEIASMLIGEEIFDDVRQVARYFNNIGGIDGSGIVAAQLSVGGRPEMSKNFRLASFVMRKKAEGASVSEIVSGVASVTGMKPEDIKTLVDNPEQWLKDQFPNMTDAQKKNLVERAKIQNIYRIRQFGRPIDKAFVGLEVPQEMVDEYIERTKASDKRVSEAVSDFKSKWLDPARGLPDWVLAIKDFASGAKNIEVARAAKTVELLKAEAKKIGFDKWDDFSKALIAVSDVQRYIPDAGTPVPFDVSRAAEGKMFTTPDEQLPAVVPDAIKNLPESIIPFVYRMRGQIDGLTKDLIGSGYVTPEQAVTLEKNLGQYVNRAYKMYNEMGYKPAEEEYKNAVKYIADQYISKLATDNAGVLTLEQVQEQAIELAKKDVEAILNKKRNPYFNASTESRNTGILKERRDIPEPIRKLMGEYTDPGTVFMMTVAKQAALKASSQYLGQLRKFGMGSLFFEKDDANRPAEYSVEIAPAGTETKSPLGGLYTTPEIAEALEAKDPTYNELTNLWMKLVGAVRYGKTVLSVTTQFKNFESNLGFAVMNGLLFTGKTGKAFSGAAEYVKGQYTKQEIDELTEKLIKLNLVGQSVGMRELKDMLGSGDLHDIALDVAVNPEGRWGKRVAKRINVFGVTSKAYRMGDDFWKAYAYLNERELVSKGRYEGKSYSALNEEEQQKVDIEASERVKNTWPTYDRVVEAAKFASKRLPILGNFPSFQAESIRTLVNTVKMAKEDMQDPQMRAAGIRRMVGIMSYVSLRAAITTMLAQAAGMAASGILGSVWGDDDEDKKKTALKHALPPYAMTADIAAVQDKKEPHKYTVVSLSSLDPYGLIPNSLNALTEGREGVFGKRMEPGVPAALIEAFSAFVEPEMTFDAVWSVVNNRDAKTGRELVNESDTDSEAFLKVMGYVYKQLEPSTISAIKRGSERGWLPESLAVFGARPMDVDLHKSFGFALSDMGRQMEAINKDYNSIKFNDKLTKEEKDAAESRAEEKKAYLISKINFLYTEFIKMGADAKVMDELIKSRSAAKTTGFDKATKKYIKTGVIDPKKLFK